MATRWTLLLALVTTCLTAPDAAACISWGDHRWVFFEEVPTGIDAPIAARVFITTVGEGSIGAPGAFFAIARIERVIKGTIDRPMVWIPVPKYTSSCGPFIKAGARGVVIGTLQQSASGALLLFVRQNDGRYFLSPPLEGAKL